MEHYDLRSCFLPDLSGLHLRIFQFRQLLSRHLPRLTAHLDQLQIQPLYVSQWFLSFFAVTCPLPMLLRIYDIILTEGASETLMRVALSLMRRNSDKIMECTELEGRFLILFIPEPDSAASSWAWSQALSLRVTSRVTPDTCLMTHR